ncbi:MAG: GntR family transcriptional regulator [Nitrospirota bacterium]|nr:GntR family transcriptional regulator [Nitrospirota bacterium]
MRIEKTVDRESKLKLYVQIYSIFKEKIEDGEWPAGTQIPTEDELCKTYDVSKVTVREAIHELVREGLLKRQQGKGTFVTYFVPLIGLVMRTRLAEIMLGEGVTVKREVLERGVRKPAEDIKTFLMTEADVYHILCKKVFNGESCIEESFFPLFLLPNIANEDIFSNSLYELIEEKGTKKIFRVMQTVEVTMVKEDKAATLEIKEANPALLINRVFIASDGTPIAYMRLIGGSSKCKIQMEFERIK